MSGCFTKEQIINIIRNRTSCADIFLLFEHIASCSLCAKLAQDCAATQSNVSDNIFARIALYCATPLESSNEYNSLFPNKILEEVVADSEDEEEKAFENKIISSYGEMAHKTVFPRKLRVSWGLGWFKRVSIAALAAVLIIAFYFIFDNTTNEMYEVAKKSNVKAPAAVSKSANAKSAAVVKRIPNRVVQTTAEKPKQALTEKSPKIILRDGSLKVCIAGGKMIVVDKLNKTKNIESQILKLVAKKLGSNPNISDKPYLVAMAPTDVLRSVSDSEKFAPKLISPKRVRLVDDTVDFSWKCAPRIEDCVIEIYSFDGKLIESREIKRKTPRIKIKLNRGKTYLWRVGSLVADEYYFSKVESFYILSQSEYNNLRRILSKYKESHLIRGIAYENAGLYYEAKMEYHKLSKINPNNKIVGKILENIDKQIRESGR